MKNIAMGFLGLCAVIMLIVFAVHNSRGELLQYERLAMSQSSTLDSMTITCNNYDGEVLSTEEIYNEFIQDCEILTPFNYRQDFFDETVIIMYYYDGPSSNEPKDFYDYYYTVEGHQVITVRNKRTLFGQTKDGQQYFYFILIDKEDIASADVIFQ